MIELFQKGGPFMWPFFVCFVIMVVLALERIWTYWWIRDEAETRKITQVITERIGTGDSSQDLQVYCDTIGRLEGHVFAVTLDRYRRLATENRSIEEVHQELRVAVGRATCGYLERRLSMVRCSAQVATLLGLLGTISGMIRSFGAIARGGIGELATVRAGVFEALMTTVVGFVIALPLLVVYVYFTNKAEQTMFQFEPYGQAFADALMNVARKTQTL
jgi:biopolymer transport protein ExbB